MLRSGVKWFIVEIYILVWGGSTMFMGKDYNSIDAKNRMIIPAKHRNELGLTCVLTKGIDLCLYIYTMKSWEDFMEKLSKLPSSDPDARAFIRHFYSNAVECEVDKNGRITLPQELREYAEIEKDLVTVGVLDKIEIWSRKQWDNEANSTQLPPSEFAKKMVEYGI